ncbi:MAG: hypothetical protein FWD71_01230 [Oscillospiraceae bacterium]|nr:hypothetical protein [Oscillospiraceae bacterium]
MKKYKVCSLILVLVLLFCITTGCGIADSASDNDILLDTSNGGYGYIENSGGQSYVVLDSEKIEYFCRLPDDWVESAKRNITDPSFDPNELTGNMLSYYITSNIIAIAYGNITDTNNTINYSGNINIIVSGDKGKTWNISNIAEPTSYISIGFTSKQDGWLVQTSDPATGSSLKKIYHSADGGKTWSETSGNAPYTGLLTGSSFVTPDIGFLCYRYYDDNGPEVYRTTDGGETWNRIDFPVPNKYKNYKFMPASPVFTDADGTIKMITALSDSAERNGVMTFKTNDYGATWTYFDFTPDSEITAKS